MLRGHFGDVFGTTIIGLNEFAELRKTILGLAGSRKDHGLVGSVQADCIETLQVQRVDGFGRKVADDASHTLVPDFSEVGYGVLVSHGRGS